MLCNLLTKKNIDRLRRTPPNGGDRRAWPVRLYLRCHSGDYEGHTDVYGRMAWDAPAPTLTGRCHSLSNGRYGHPTQDRAISLREAAALQSFPDGYTFFGSNKHIAQQIGNAVPVALAEALGAPYRELREKGRKKENRMNRRVSSLSFALALWAGMLGLVGCRREQSQESVASVRMGYLPITSDASFFVAVEKGLFKAQGLQVEPIKFETSNQALEAIVAGRIDATAIVALEAALALEANTPEQFRIIEMTAATADTKVHRIVVKTDSPIKTLADLKGKKVGTFPGSQMVVFLKLILGRYFDAEKEVEIVQLKPPLQPQALESGQVDALFCLEPTCTLLESKGLARAISVNPLYEFIQKPFPTAVSVVSARLATEKPKVVGRIVGGLTAAHQFLKAHPEESALTFPKYAPVDSNIVAKVALYDNWGPDAMDRESVQKLADLYAEKGIVPKRIATTGLYFTAGK